MRYLFVLRFYSGLSMSMLSGKWAPFGLPDVYRLLETLSARAIPATVVLLVRENESTDVVTQAFTRRFPGLNVDFHVIPARSWPRGQRMTGVLGRVVRRFARIYNDIAQFALVLRQYAKWDRCDLVYVDRRNVVLGAILAWRGFPVVLRFHGVADWNRFASPLRLFLAQPLVALALKAPFKLVLSSEDGSPARQFLESALARSTPFRVILNGVDPVPAAMVPPDIRNRYGFTRADWPIVLFVGRLSADKGIDDYVHALIELNRQRSAFYALFLCGGSPWQDVRDRLVAGGLGGRIAFETSLPHAEARQAFAASDIYVSTNRLANLTNTVLEAIEAGTCIVLLGSDARTHADEATERLLPDEVVARVPRDAVVPHLVRVMTELIDDPALLATRKARTRSLAQSLLWSWDQHGDFELRLLRAAATGSGQTGPEPVQQTAYRASPHELASSNWADNSPHSR